MDTRIRRSVAATARMGSDTCSQLSSLAIPGPRQMGYEVPTSRKDWTDHGGEYPHPNPHHHPFMWNGQPEVDRAVVAAEHRGTWKPDQPGS